MSLDVLLMLAFIVSAPIGLLIAGWWFGAIGVRARFHAAHRTLHAEFMATRRAMNDAAGQSWRNLAE